MSEIKLRIVPHSEEPCEECGRAGDINARYNAPHYCDNPTCPGNITRQKLEMWDEIKKGLEEIVLFAKNNPGRGFSCGQMAEKLLERIQKIGGA